MIMISCVLKPGRAVAGAKQLFINHIIVSYENPSRGTQEVVCLYIFASFSSLTYSSRLNHTS